MDTFTHYPRISLISGRFANAAEERETVKAFILNQRESQAKELSAAGLDMLLREWLVTEEYSCQLRTLSDVIRENNVDSIDLLKIDVEKSELDVLAGIEPADWTRIKQVVVEIHDIDGRLNQVTALLEKEGYDLTVEQDRSLKDTRLFNVYAVRRGAQTQPSNHSNPANASTPLWNSSTELIGDLRAFLKEKLPAYLVPSAFVFLDSLPVTSNGKIDRRALPAPESGRTESEAPLVSARNPIEERLASIWSDLLGVEKVGIHDNFFELGGDSILSIQIVARANQAGLGLTPRQIFQYQTLAQLAAVAGSNQSAQVEQLTVSGAVPLTPVQYWFFEQNLPNPHHWNQSVLLELRQALNPARLERVIKELLVHHDALRIRFVFGELGWEQVNTPVEKLATFSLIDLAALSEPEQTQALAAAVAESQASLNLSSGPLMRATYFDRGPDKPANLSLVIHHLVVDGISWRIILEDLQAGYQQERRGETISLSRKTTDFKTWAEGLTEYALAASARQEVPYWLTVLPQQAFPLPVDFHGGANTEASARTVTVALSVEETRALLQEVPAAYRTYINEVLLSALAHSFSQSRGEPFLLIDLEGHGREELPGGIDVSRTVGWFTAIYPVLLKAEKDLETGARLQVVKEQLRQIPQHGIGYGVSRYLGGEAERASFEALPQAEVSFNYLGQLDQVFVDSGLFSKVREIDSPLRSPQGRRPYLWEINAAIIDGRLKLSWTYSENSHHRATIESLAQNFLEAIEEIIAGSRSGETYQITPVDFPLAKLSGRKLAQLVETYQDLEDVYPLAPTQEGLLFDTLYETDSGVYVEQVSCILGGEMNVPAFVSAWQQVIERHPILRTAFVWENLEQPLQVVSRHVPSVFVKDDWRKLSVSEQEQRLNSFLQSDRAQGFDLHQAPLTRFALFRVADEAHRFVWSHHHLLLDGWSLPIILNEVFAFYEAFSQGRELQLQPAQPYLNYINWLRQQDTTGEETFWRESLAGFSVPTRLAIGRARGNMPPSSRETGQQAHLSVTATSALQAFARRYHLTLNTLLQGAWALLLSHYSGAADVVFGTPVSGRPVTLPGAETMVGILINTLPVRVQIPFNGPVSGWLRELQDQQSANQKHQLTPMVLIQGWTEVPRGAPLFESVLSLSNYPVMATLLGPERSLRLEQVDWFERTHYPLTVQVTPGAELLLKVDYDHHRFDPLTIERILGHFQTVLEAISAEPEIRIADVPLLTEAERRQVLLNWNDTRRDYAGQQCLHELFEEQVERAPEAIAISFEGEQVSYAELNRRANKLAHHLRKLGVGAEVLVGICVERSIEMVVGLLGILKAGAAYVPLDSSYPLERLSFMLEDAALSVLLTQEKLEGILPSHWGHTICLDIDWATIDEEDASNPSRVATEENLAYVIYTSGSTGKPKGAMLHHRGVVNCLRWMQETYQLDDSDRFLLKTSLNFDPSVWEMFWTWWTGGCVVIARPEGHLDSAYLVKTIVREKVTSVYFVPPMLRVFLEEAGVENITSLRRVICGGEGLPKETMERFFERLGGADLHHSYGPTEASIAATEWQCEPGGNEGMAPIGRPLANTETYLLDEHLRPVAVGVSGELYIGGVGVGRGYLHQPQLTSERFVPHPFSGEPGQRLYRTGDVARYLADGNIEFLGRVDSQIKLRGYRIELGEIEAALSAHAAVETAVVVLREEGTDDKQLVAYVLTKKEATEGWEEVRNYLRARLPEYMVPAWIVMLDQMPLTVNGKVDRRALPALGTNGARQKQTVVSTRSPIEEVVANIWSEVLGVGELSATANFFESGGHSLLATQVILRVREAFGVEMNLRSLFESPTVRGFASQIQETINTDLGLVLPTLSAAQRNGELPLSYAQQRLWFADQLTPDSLLYNVAVAVRMSGQLSVVALEQTLSEIMRRHEVLRTSFSEQEGKPVQVIAPSISFDLPVTDLSGLAPSERDSAARQLAQEEAGRPFSLARVPLLRALLLKLAEAEHIVVLTMHHIISDGWSTSVLIREVGVLYEAYLEEQVSPLPELSIQYADYAIWQRNWLQGEVLERQLEYWKEQLSGTSATLQLPTNGERPLLQSFRGAHAPFSLTPELSEQLKELSRREGVTLFMTLLAAWQTLLYYYTHEEHINVGTPVAGRNQLATESLIGFFVNTVVMRSELSGNPDFKELLRRVRETCLGAYAHQDVPFEKLVEALQPERDLSRSAFFQVWFTLVEAPLEKLQLKKLKLEEFALEAVTAKFDLALLVTDAKNGLSGVLEYNSDLFDSSTISRMLRHWSTLLSSIVAGPQSKLDTLLAVLTEADRKRRSQIAQEFKAADRQTLKNVKRKVIRD
jgi:amino acid adenylation domain-containing protein/non-ribosomal peptide synthase protein (TIGR01720 family)